MNHARAHHAPIDRSVVLPFIVFTLVWSSTWIVITGQLGVVAPQWSVAYRFIVASAGMAVVARLGGHSLRPDRPLLASATVLGLCQFCGNFNSVYIAERTITSGIVATIFALLIIPNSLLAWALLGQRPTRRFALGGTLAACGVGILFAQELRNAHASPHGVAVGLAFTVVGLMGASISNVFQARPQASRFPLPVLLTWSMLIGSLLDIFLALFIAGPPTFDPRPSYWVGLVYLALAASTLCFSLYFPVVRKIGPGRAAYSSVLVPVVAMALSTAFEDYRWTLIAAVGAILALAGMAIALGGRADRVPNPDAA